MSEEPTPHKVKVGDIVKYDQDPDRWLVLLTTDENCYIRNQTQAERYGDDDGYKHYEFNVPWSYIKAQSCEPAVIHEGPAGDREMLLGRIQELQQRLTDESRMRREAERSRPSIF